MMLQLSGQSSRDRANGAAISERQQQFEEITRSQSATTQPSVHREEESLSMNAQCEGRTSLSKRLALGQLCVYPPITSTMGSNVATTSSMPDRNTGGSTRLPPPPPPSGLEQEPNIPSGPEHQLQCFKLGFQPQARTNTKGRMLILQLSH
ncbi:hypothetical protein Bca4012_000772 [Brassica carinata]